MKCEKTRDILNILIDKRSNSQANEALAHAENCESCREWYAETQAMLDLFESAFENESTPDIATSVKARLPERHPASVPEPSIIRKLVVYTALGWVVGVLVLVVAALIWFHTESGANFLLQMNGSGGSLSILTSIPKAIMELMVIAKQFVMQNMEFVINFLIVDTLLLCMIALIWRKRLKTAVFSIVQ